MIAFVPLTVHQIWFRKSLSDKLTQTHADTDFENYQHRVIINDYISFYNIVLLNYVRQKKTVMLHLITKYMLSIFCHCLFMEMYAIFQKSF